MLCPIKSALPSHTSGNLTLAFLERKQLYDEFSLLTNEVMWWYGHENARVQVTSFV